MNARSDDKFRFFWWRYILLSIPIAYLLSLVIQFKLTWVFWSYFAIMGVSALIAKWNVGEENKSNFISYSVHTAMICAFTLFMWGVVTHLITWLSSN